MPGMTWWATWCTRRCGRDGGVYADRHSQRGTSCSDSVVVTWLQSMLTRGGHDQLGLSTCVCAACVCATQLSLPTLRSDATARIRMYPHVALDSVPCAGILAACVCSSHQGEIDHSHSCWLRGYPLSSCWPTMVNNLLTHVDCRVTANTYHAASYTHAEAESSCIVGF
jgi:hypothetical protein